MNNHITIDDFALIILSAIAMHKNVIFSGKSSITLESKVTSLSETCSKTSISKLITKLHLNSLSSEFIRGVCENSDVLNHFIPLISKDANKRLQRIRGLNFVNKVLRNVNYMLIKDLDIPFALLSDLDLLLYDYIELLKAAITLENEGCSIYKFRLLAHPFKVMATNCKDGTFEIDLYPHPMWIRRIVASNDEVFKTKYFGIRYGIEVPLPTPPMDFYLVATHAWSHLRLTLAETLYLLKLSESIKEEDWFQILEIAHEWGTLDSIYTVSLVVNTFSSKVYGYSVIPEEIIKEMKKKYVLRGKAEKWLYSIKKMEFPIRFPASLAVFYSSLYGFQVLWKKDLMSALYEVLSTYLSYSSNLFLKKQDSI
jgi:hypothetical protein